MALAAVVVEACFALWLAVGLSAVAVELSVGAGAALAPLVSFGLVSIHVVPVAHDCLIWALRCRDGQKCCRLLRDCPSAGS